MKKKAFGWVVAGAVAGGLGYAVLMQRGEKGPGGGEEPVAGTWLPPGLSAQIEMARVSSAKAA